MGPCFRRDDERFARERGGVSEILRRKFDRHCEPRNDSVKLNLAPACGERSETARSKVSG
jgi:hypothetical protein